MAMKKADRVAKQVAELEALDEIQDRIDQVARDLSTGKNRYAVIDAWDLGKLLGVNFDDRADWVRESFVYGQELEDAGFDHPFADNIALLEGLIPPARYAQLSAMVDELEDDQDLPLTKTEIALLREAYAETIIDESSDGIDLCVRTLAASDGTEVRFEVSIDNSGESFDAKSPYDLKEGRGFDADGLVPVD